MVVVLVRRFAGIGMQQALDDGHKLIQCDDA